tara:strand:+ start:1000 stop:1665 length:666 start_codon:yes stop_codon:yes gene_type:complete
VDPLTHRRLGISDSLLDAVKGITEKKKLDPVGKADADIDNDGDVDKSDEYLKNRRKAIKKSMKKDDKKPSGSKDQVDTEPQLDDKMNESVELDEESIKITYKNPKDGKTHTMNVFTAQDATQAVKDLTRQGMNIIKKEMGEEKSPDGVDKGAIDKHNCATHVYHEEWGAGQTITTMHAEPDEHGWVEWYDVMFDHGIEKGVPVAEMKVTKEMSHGNHKKKK